jgi:hypothetical protein
VRVIKAGIWISVGTLLVSLLGVLPAYLIFFDKPDLVYETQIVNIPLPKDLPGQLPDTLAIVTVQNIGRRPSVDVRGSVTVGGALLEYLVQGPNAAYGRVSSSRSDSQILFSSDRLASGEYPIRVSAWFKGANSDPDVGVSDARGAARKVNSIAAEHGKYKEAGSGFLGLLVGLLGSFTVIFTFYQTSSIRKSISEAARRISENNEKLRSVTVHVGTTRERVPADDQ